ncbi:hypothetical protein FRC08_002429 [Ceratobasidium sp. 394]|nr:hypothetical protein FRC08_002429 [Ceratobasidium sp. 394]
MGRTKMTARKTTGAKPPRKSVPTVIGEVSTTGALDKKAGKAGKTVRKAETKATAAANDPKNTSVAAKKPEILGGQTSAAKGVPKSRAKGSVDGVISESPATPAAPIAQSK